MKKIVLILSSLCAFLFVQAQNYADYVNPLMGTQSFFELSSGNTYPTEHDVVAELVSTERAAIFRFIFPDDSVFAVPPVFDGSYYGFVIHEIRKMILMNMVISH